jgi:membrane associated rhomboid family serine protease
MIELTNIIKNSPVASVTFLLNIIISLYALLLDRSLYDLFMLRPYNVSRGKNLYTVITSGFIHADFSHLFFNMFTFFFFAFYLETILGHWQFGLLYILTLIFSDIPYILKHKDDVQSASLGASGAISGVLFSFIIFKPLSTIIIYFIPLPAILYGVLYLGYCVFASRKQFNNVNHSAHFWGAVSGVIITIILKPDIINTFINTLINIGN